MSTDSSVLIYYFKKLCVQHTWTYKITHTHTLFALNQFCEVVRHSLSLSVGKKNTFIGCNFENQCCPKGLHFSRYSCVRAISWGDLPNQLHIISLSLFFQLPYWCFSFITLRKTHPTSCICLFLFDRSFFFFSLHVAIHPHSVEHWYTHTHWSDDSNFQQSATAEPQSWYQFTRRCLTAVRLEFLDYIWLLANTIRSQGLTRWDRALKSHETASDRPCLNLV